MKIEKITCIQLRGEFPDFCTRLVAPDYGMPLIATILSRCGYDVLLYVENITPPEWDRIADSDLVCFSSWNAAADKTYRLAMKIRSTLGIPIVIGGVHASYFPDSCLRYCDYVVFGEGDETIVELVETLARGGNVEEVAGIAYRVGDRVVRTAPRHGPARFDTIPNFSLIKGYPRMNLFNILLKRKKPVLMVQSSRGCPFKCTFCIVNTMFPGGYRTRDVESVIRDLRDKRRYGWELMFVDNEFAADRAYAKKLTRRLIEEDLGFRAVVFARVEIAEDDELLLLMRQAGITHIYQGYESIHPETLIAYRKRQTVDQIVAAIEKLHSFGFGILASFVLGADTDTLETINSTVDFVLKHKLSNAYFWPIWGHFPEEKSGYQTIVPWYRGIFRGWRYCDGHFVTHFPLQMPPSKLQIAIIDAYRAVYCPTQILRALIDRKYIDAWSKILHRYQWQDIEKGVREYIAFLEKIEEELYDSAGYLREDLLLQRVEKDPRWTFQAGNRTIESLGFTPPELPVSERRNISCAPISFGSTDPKDL
jgi:anaerobic magnesium-protoporphyrin IX monomethyl ester cyclase